MNLRLHKDRVTVLCGMVDCGEQLGRVHGAVRHLVLMPGYRRDGDGTFRLTPHAEKRIREGHRPRRSSGGNVTNPNDEIDATMTGVGPGRLPAAVKCRTCGMVQQATADALDVIAPNRDDGPETWGPGRIAAPEATTEAPTPQRRRVPPR